MVRSMLSGRDVSKRFWPEAVVWATHVLNRSPTLSVKDMTPKEAWSDLKSAVHYFRVFGCIAYAHIPEAQIKKLDKKGIKCVHLGSNESKGYKIYDPTQNKVIISRDIVFKESKGWNWSEKRKEPILQADINDEKNNRMKKQILSVTLMLIMLVVKKQMRIFTQLLAMKNLTVKITCLQDKEDLMCGVKTMLLS